jgi:glutamate formiminotransferase/formiminotetrahydrofolate cyclodeaminase
MSQKLVECVPNFSEGRNPAVIKEITDRIEAVAGVRLLDVDAGGEMNRVVVTFVGSPEAAAEAAFRAIARAAEVIDMSKHHGTHPRIGATDVCPFVPVQGMTMDDCVELARQVGRRVGEELRIPVYLYEAAASRPERRNLATVRKGEYEGLAKKLKDPEWAPDFGPAEFSARSGATVIGAREFLIAWNIDLNTRDASQATDIAYELRERGRSARAGVPGPFYNKGELLKHTEGRFLCGNCPEVFAAPELLFDHCRSAHGYEVRDLYVEEGIDPEALVGKSVKRPGLFKAVKAIGWHVPEFDRAQISINLISYKTTPIATLYDKARELAAERGLVVTGSEIVGLVPQEALLDAGRHYLLRQRKSAGIPTRDILETAVQSLGLRDVAKFELATKVLGYREPDPKSLVAKRSCDFVDEVSRDSPAPGGGSVAALAGALGAALASMVANLTCGKAGYEKVSERMGEIAVRAQQLKDALVAAVDADTNAFAAYMEARKLPDRTDEEKSARKKEMQEGLVLAAEVPLETARLSLEAISLCRDATEGGNKASVTDSAVGSQMAWAALVGGVLNVRINLGGIADHDIKERMENACRDLEEKGKKLADETLEIAYRRMHEKEKKAAG